MVEEQEPPLGAAGQEGGCPVFVLRVWVDYIVRSCAFLLPYDAAFWTEKHEHKLRKSVNFCSANFFLTGCLKTQQAAMSDCEKYGFQKGTQEYAQCLMVRESERSRAFERSMQTLYCSDPYVSC